ncbi:MAG: alpha/beta fold hydrolase [Bacteroidetes bacterium]|nr:alpha/beta fold hydrolase [Bacteroidota bacterium]
MRLFYRHFGAGDPVIILHGLYGISDNWVTFGSRLAKKYSVYIPDQRNHGQSPHSSAFSYPAMVSDLAEFIADHNLHSPVLIGHSMGGMTAMHFTMEHPDQISRLIVVDISPRAYRNHWYHLTLLDAMLSLPIDQIATRKEAAEKLGKTVRNPRILQFLLKNLYWSDRRTLAWRLNLPVIAECIPDMFLAVEPNSLFSKPTLFIRGGDSDYIRDDDIPMIMRLFPNAEIETIAGASHWVQADEPEKFFIMVEKFLSPKTGSNPHALD